MRLNNEIQEAVIKEWTEGVQKAKDPQARRIVRNRIAKKYDLTVSMVRGIIEIRATEGLTRVVIEDAKTDGHRWEPINYHELVGDLKERVETLERKFEYLLDGVQKVLEDGETMGIHLQHLRTMGRWMKKRDNLDVEGIRSTPLNEDKDPPLLENEFIEPQIETKPMTDRTNEIEILRRRIDKTRERIDSREAKKPSPRLLFSGIEEGKKAIPR